jgi:pyruvate-formate lyase-activating enzyme
MRSRVSLLYADSSGRVLEHPTLCAAGLKGERPVPLQAQDLVPLPPGSTLFTIQKGIPIAYRGQSLTPVDIVGGQRVFAVAAFLPAGYCRLYLPAYLETSPRPLLPLWAYTAVAFHRGKICLAATLVEKAKKADPRVHGDDEGLARAVRSRLIQSPRNRLLRQLARCALEYHCFAAKNLFLRRWEAPLPTSPTCNARCLGCLSLQEGECCASQERIRFVPAVQEITELAVPHLVQAPDPIVSFGQGCEGEPLLLDGILAEAIRRIRCQTSRGTINLNTNGHSAVKLLRLADAGLDSVRISLNSTNEKRYQAYFRPRGYGLREVVGSIRAARQAGLYTSVNLLVFPGYTDAEEEVRGLLRLLGEIPVDLLQMRNLAIDPWYYQRLVPRPSGRVRGIWELIHVLRQTLPGLKVGYFNRQVPWNRA